MTGVWGAINFKPNLELALALHPGTSRVVVIGGVADIDKYWTALVREDFRAYESSLEFTYLTGLTVPEMRKALAGLPSGTIVFFVSSMRDNAGNISRKRGLFETSLSCIKCSDLWHHRKSAGPGNRRRQAP